MQSTVSNVGQWGKDREGRADTVAYLEAEPDIFIFLAWSCVLDTTTSYPDGTRLYAVNFIRSILAVRQQRVSRLKDQTIHSTAQDVRLSSSLKSSDSQDFDMFDDFDYEAIDMQIEKVYFDDADCSLAQVRSRIPMILFEKVFSMRCLLTNPNPPSWIALIPFSTDRPSSHG